MSVRLTPAEYSATVAKVANINARAEKRGWTGRVTLDAEQVTVTETDQFGFTIEYKAYDVTLGGEAPSYNGWTFLAALDFDQHAGLITRVAPGVEFNVEREGVEPGRCDHCGVERYRRTTYVVRNDETGEQKVVGSTCIKDFLGWSGSFAFISEKEASDEIEAGWGSYRDRDYATETVLAVAVAAIKAYGFAPASSYGQSTKSVVQDYLSNRNDKATRELRAEVGEFVEGSAEAAKKVRAFILSDDFSGTSEYVINLKAVLGPEFVTDRNFGLVASAPQALAKFEERTLIREKEAAKPSSWFGTEKEKVTFTGVISGVNYIESAYGSTVLYTLRNEETGNVVKWFASREALGDTTVVGTTVTITGTVKKHEEFRGVKSTVLTRCKKV